MQYTNVTWRDGQPYSEMFDDIYYSSNDNEVIPGEGEFAHVFFNNNRLPARWQDCNRFVIGELGFGSALNCILTIREWLKQPEEDRQHKRLHYIAIEKYPLSPDTLAEFGSRYPRLKAYYDELLAGYPPAIAGVHSRNLFDGRMVIQYRFMDVVQALSDESMNVDAWYLDGFSPAKNPGMWSAQVFELLEKNSHKGTTCSTYTCAGFVRRNMLAAGFDVNRVSGYGNKREMLVAELVNRKADTLTFKDRPWFNPPRYHATTDSKVTIIGAGIAGLSVAYALVKRGWQVTVIDRHGDMAREATSNPAPIVYPRLSVDNEIDTEFFTSAWYYTLHVMNKLQQNYQRQFWFGDGLLQLMDKQRIEKIINRYGFNNDYLSMVEGQLGEQARVKIPAAGVVLPAVLCDAIAKECGEGLHILAAELDAVRYQDKKWRCLSASTLISQSEVLVIANGIGINDLGLPIGFPVEAIRGQVVELNTGPDLQHIRQTINASVHITTAINGKHYLGASYIRNARNLDIDPEETAQLLASLSELVPGMHEPVEVSDIWTGFRTVSKDRVPFAGAIPDRVFFETEYADINHGRINKSYLPAKYLDGLYISAAHGSRGFTTSFLCAEIIASMIVGEPAPVPRKVMDYLSPSRTIVNDLKRR